MPSRSEVAAIGTLYRVVEGVHAAAIASRLADWAQHREDIYGALERKRAVDRKALRLTYRLPEEFSLHKLLFVLDTYYVLRLRFHAFRALGLTESAPSGMPKTGQARGFLSHLMGQTAFDDFGVTNYGGADLFDWVADFADDELLGAIDMDLRSASHEYPDGPALVSRDLARSLHQHLIPKQVRHALGSYYTPRWLADWVLDRAGVTRGDYQKKIVDPTCGSGTFLVATLARVFGTTADLGSSPLAYLAEGRLVGYDVDPVAVIAAKSNLLYWLSAHTPPEDRQRMGIEMPVYLSDSILAADLFTVGGSSPSAGRYCLRAGGRSYNLPADLVSSRRWSELIAGLGTAAEPRAFVQRFTGAQDVGDVVDLAQNLRTNLCRPYPEYLQAMLRDAPRPAASAESDVVIGNPPWVNWEHLPPDYRDAIAPIWHRLGRFDLTGRDRAFS